MIIESLQNATIKNTAKLLQKKERDKTGFFLCEGEHLTEEAAAAHILDKVFILPEDKRGWPCPAIQCTQAVLNKLSAQKSDASVIGLCHKPNLHPANEKAVLILDRVQDPGNVGTLIRTALSFGMDEVILSQGCADLYNPKTIQSAQGALFHIPCIEADPAREIKRLKEAGVQVLAAALHHDSVASSTMQTPDAYALLIGNEGKGLNEELIDESDQIVHIEMKTFESLNAAIAGSILMYRLQMLPKKL